MRPFVPGVTRLMETILNLGYVILFRVDCRMAGINAKKVVAAILLLIPFAVYFDIPFYNVVNPEIAGLPFFYWFQIVMLPVSALLFIIAAVLIDMK